MASSREYLQSIISACRDLQEASDAKLNAIQLELAEIDEQLHESVDAVSEL